MLQKLLLHFALKNKKRVVMIEEFIDSVLIIDDKEEEIKDLKNLLEKKDIWVTYYNPPTEKHKIDKITSRFRNRKLLFLDLRIDEAKTTIDNISVILRPLLKKIISNNFGNYGIVMWTKHESHIIEFKEKIQKDANDYQLPLFVIQMNKSKYLSTTFDNVLNDLETELQKSTAANFFINWSNLIQKGKDKAITSIFQLIPDYQKQDKNLEFLLCKMALNYTGIPFDNIDDDYPLSIDAIKAFNDLLASEINALSQPLEIFTKKNEILFNRKDKKTIDPKTKINKVGDELTSLFSGLNSKLLIDEVNIQQNKIIPGNVYEIMDDASKLITFDLPEGARPIIIEMTPPCDFSNNRKTYPRVLSGYIQDLNLKDKRSGDKFYRELWPVKLKGKETPQIIIFDFSMLGFVEEGNLKNNKKYTLLFRLKDKLFADILQKMSAHIARLGLSIIH